MKSRLVIAALSALWLSACSLFSPRYDSAKPQVDIDPATKTITVSPRVLTFEKDQKDVLIVWQLPKDASRRANYRFTEKDGIVIEGEITNRIVRGAATGENAARAATSIVIDPQQNEIVDCKVRADGLEFTCLNRHTRPGTYKYTIRLTDGGSQLSLDPLVDNW